MAQRPALKQSRAKRILDRVEEDNQKTEATGKQLHPEIRRLRAKQAIEASSILQGEDKNNAMAVYSGKAAADLRKKAKRSYSPTARVLLPHCLHCGHTHHKSPKCPYKNVDGSDTPGHALVSLAHQQNKQIARIVSKLKYTQIDVRAPGYESRATSMARAPLHMSFLSMARATVQGFVKMLDDEELITDLKGAPCPREKCKTSEKVGFISSHKLLGHRIIRNNQGPNINRRSAYHRCDTCGTRQLISMGNPIFRGFTGPGSYGISIVTMAMWNCVEGVTLSVSCRQLNINQKTCQAYYDRASLIMAFEAHRLQDAIIWGTGTSKTVEVEIDCTVICKWREVIDGVMAFFYYVYMGARQRGDLSKFALMSYGVSHTLEVGRVPPENKEKYGRVPFVRVDQISLKRVPRHQGQP